ncbi:hypothetical protein DLAC_01125 [Tieghemostelium lacteum]|uniref:Uncharacterized protein n=1 Tax=Tieghemostelium lacteum TaxID=361077 RepID=A0A152A7W9_TIELA|nr:hypothetical protein DLAC_01125 [Tieghemostelium lacteum]|eukprot:KYR02294.1 hypothetical protein DLAC_01125 [Tieghemostelium lacteum]
MYILNQLPLLVVIFLFIIGNVYCNVGYQILLDPEEYTITTTDLDTGVMGYKDASFELPIPQSDMIGFVLNGNYTSGTNSSIILYQGMTTINIANFDYTNLTITPISSIDIGEYYEQTDFSVYVYNQELNTVYGYSTYSNLLLLVFDFNQKTFTKQPINVNFQAGYATLDPENNLLYTLYYGSGKYGLIVYDCKGATYTLKTIDNTPLPPTSQTAGWTAQYYNGSIYAVFPQHQKNNLRFVLYQIDLSSGTAVQLYSASPFNINFELWYITFSNDGYLVLEYENSSTQSNLDVYDLNTNTLLNSFIMPPLNMGFRFNLNSI